MLNRGTIMTLADYIESHPEGFDMGFWSTCIAGKYQEMVGYEYFGPEYAKEALGLTYEQTRDLFLATGAYDTRYQQAVRVLRHLALTGVVDWNVTPYPEVNTALPPFKVPVRNGLLGRIRELFG